MLAIGVVLVIIVLISLRYWQDHQSIKSIASVQSYQEVSDYLASGQPDAVAIAEKFIHANNNSYGVLAALQLAKYFVEQNDFAKADQQLAQAQNQTKDDNLLAQINLRLARVNLQERKWDQALKTLDKVKYIGWEALAQDTRGDVLLAKGDIQGARKAYTKCLKSNVSQTLGVFLRIKLNNLPN